jgi:hypothetical protein
MSGLDVHHDTAWVDAHGTRNTPLCSSDHEGKEHREIPCSESCEIRLSEAPATPTVKVPVIAESVPLLSIFEDTEYRVFPITRFVSSPRVEPPTSSVSLTDPTFTGRYLV